MKHDLLVEPILSWRGSDRVKHEATLPAVLAALSRAEVVDFPRARAHQQHPWSMFLTQLAAIAMKRSGIEQPPHEEARWKEMLLALTGDQREPWCLVVEDLSKPAFFQPPVPEGELRKPGKPNPKTGKLKPGAEWKIYDAPDDLDILVTSKKHDVKGALIVASDDPEPWVYALCSLQTMQGYPGRGYTPIARMNGGYGNRPRVGTSINITFGDRFARDLDVLVTSWNALVRRGFSDEGTALVWLEPWNGTGSLSIGELAPHFIEICWRVRLVEDELRLIARYTTASTGRCAPEIQGGDVGDAWAPVARDAGTVLTVGSGGYHYKLLVEMLFGGRYAPAPAQELRDDDPDSLALWLSALARGQGETEGLHERVIPLPGKARRAFLSRRARDALGKRAEARVKRAGEMRSKVLYPALKLIALGDTTVSDALDERIDERFFEALFSSLELDEDAAQAEWDDELVRLAQDELESAIERSPLPDARFWRATTAARGMFFGCLKKRFPDAFARLSGSFTEAAMSEEVR